MILAVVQGLAELLPISSSAHVIVAAKLMKMPPFDEPEMTLLLLMLHTGTMFAMIFIFGGHGKGVSSASGGVFKQQAVRLLIATMLTAAVGLPLKKGIEKGMEKSGYVRKDTNGGKAEIEMLFDNLGLIAGALAAVGVLILIAGWPDGSRITMAKLAFARPLGSAPFKGCVCRSADSRVREQRFPPECC